MRGRRPLQPGPVIAAAGAIVLIVSLFLDWYEPDISGWTVFEALDLVLAGLALAVLAAAAVRLGLPLAGGRNGPLGGPAVLLLGSVALLVVASQALNHPPAGVDHDAELGQWLALGGAGLMLIGGFLGLARIWFEFDGPGSPPDSSGRDPRQPVAPKRSGGAAEEPTEKLGPPE